ncbi:MAG: DUF4292 domain-containing protein [Flavobacteriia bacterium]|jgi:hypothetical protein
MIRSINLFYLGIGLLLFSCAKELTDADRQKLPRQKAQDLVNVMDSLSHRKPDFFYTKIATDYSDTNQNISFKTSIRMVKDSAINALITYANIPIVNSIITNDTVKIVNKRDKCYITQSLGYIKDNFGVDFSYRNLEELILGMPLDYDTTQKYFQIHDPYNYTISSHKKRDIKRLDRNDKEIKEDIIIKYFIADSLNGLKGMFIESPSDTTSIKVEYITREMVSSYNVPKEVYIVITSPRNQMRINMNYNKIEIDEPQPLHLVIPEGYEKCD